MRKFSEELPQEREFEIGGELFKWRYPHWEVGAELWDEGDPKQEDSNGNFSFRADTEFALEKIPLFLDPVNDAQKRWKTLVARKTDPVPRHQFIQLYRWLFQVTAGLPTTPPSASEPGGGDSDTSLQEGLSSPEETPTA